MLTASIKTMSVFFGDACTHRFVRNANNGLVEDDSPELVFNREFFASKFPQRAQIESAESSERKCDGAITDDTNTDKKGKNGQTSE